MTSVTKRHYLHRPARPLLPPALRPLPAPPLSSSTPCHHQRCIATYRRLVCRRTYRDSTKKACKFIFVVPIGVPSFILTRTTSLRSLYSPSAAYPGPHPNLRRFHEYMNAHHRTSPAQRHCRPPCAAHSTPTTSKIKASSTSHHCDALQLAPT